MKIEYKEEFERFTKYKYAKQEAINYILEKPYGTTISYSELGRIFNLNIQDDYELIKLKKVVSQLKPILIDHSYVLKTIIGVGYYILKPKQISGYCYHTYIRKTESLLNKSNRILQHVNLNDLSAIRLKEYKEVYKLNNEVSNSIEDTIYKSDYEKNKLTYDNLDD